MRNLIDFTELKKEKAVDRRFKEWCGLTARIGPTV
jgi:hypothetical protein